LELGYIVGKRRQWVRREMIEYIVGKRRQWVRREMIKDSIAFCCNFDVRM
jgi:hypothetical protein